MLNRKRLRQAHVFTLLLRISVPSNRESSDVAVVRISEKVKQSDNFVYAITKYVSLPLITLSSLYNYYCHQIASNPYIHHPSQITIVISSSMQKTGFQTVKFLPGILTLTLILSSTFLSSKTTVISNSSFKKIMAPTVPAAYIAERKR